MISEEEVKKWLSVLQRFSDTRESDLKLFDILDDLTSFLSQLNQFIKQKGNPRAVLQQIPSVGKLFGLLVQNHVIQCSENTFKNLFQCIISLASSAADNIADRATRKTVAWTQSQLKHMIRPSPACPGSVLLISQFIGNTATEASQTMTEKIINSICYDLMKHDGAKWNPSVNDLVPSLSHQGLSLRTLSDMCVVLVSQPIVRPLIETILLTGNSTTDLNSSSSDHRMVECLSPRFLASVTDMTRQKELNFESEGCGVKMNLSYQAIVSLWRRYQPSFESQIFDLVEAVVLRYPDASRNDIKKLIKSCYLDRACLDYEELFMTAIQIIYSFVHSSPENERLSLLLKVFNESL